MDLNTRLLEEIIEKSDSGKIVLNPDSQVLLWNRWIADMTGIPAAEAKGHLLTDLFNSPLPVRFLATVANAINNGMNSVLCHSFTPHPLPLPHPFRQGELMFQKVTVQALKNDPGRHCCLIDITDVSQSVAREEKLQEQSDTLKHMAKHDPLTGLPNRTLFREYLDHTFERARRKQHKFALMFLDLDSFKEINDTLGHHTGDLVLEELGRIFLELLRKSDVVARLGGDEFVIIADGLVKEEEAAIVAEKILQSLNEPLHIEGKEVQVSISIGIATFPDCGANPEMLLRNADTALSRAKENGNHSFEFFTSTMNTSVKARKSLEKELRLAMEREEFVVYYQPQIDLRSNSIVGAEALIRWNHPERGILAPGYFLNLASETGLIVPIGEWVVSEACRQVRQWSTDKNPPFRIGINISGHHFHRNGAMDSLAKILENTGVDPKYIELELTEEVLIERVQENIEALWKLREMGVHIAVDDFGTGYSSLSYLKHFPINTLKIDRSFVQQLLANEKDAIITKSVIALAHDLGLRVVAEGVETADQLPFLLDQNCDEGQGYYYSRPVPPSEFWKYFNKKNKP